MRPSTPAVREPRFARTRCQATWRVAGSKTRLNRSWKVLSCSDAAHLWSLVWTWSTRASASLGTSHGAAVFTADLPSTRPGPRPAALLRHVTGSPGLRLLRGLRPALAPSADGAPARRHAGRVAGRAVPGRVPRSLPT